MNKVSMNLQAVEGNAFNLLGAFAANARRQGWNQQAIDSVHKEAMAGDYDHLLRTLLDHTARPEDGPGGDAADE